MPIPLEPTIRTRTGQVSCHDWRVKRWATLLPALLIAAPVLAQEPSAAEFTLNVNVDLVELRVTVLDERERNVVHLAEADFSIFEDQIQQQISLFRHEDMPVSLGIVIDNSRSMERKKSRIDTAALSFVRHSNPDDETFLIHFDDTVRLARDFTSDITVIGETLASISPYGQTALFDAMFLGVETMQGAIYEQKAMLLVTDGADNASLHTSAEVLERVRRSNIAVYPIGLLSDSEAGRAARAILEEIADLSGGRAFFPSSVDEIPALTEQIARELRELYTLGYIPTNARRDGMWRSVRVYVEAAPEAPRYDINYRHGYYAPDD